MNETLFDLCKSLNIDLGKGIDFSYDKFYKAFPGVEIDPLWGSNGYVIGIIVNGINLKYPFTTETFNGIIENIKFDNLKNLL